MDYFGALHSMKMDGSGAKTLKSKKSIVQSMAVDTERKRIYTLEYQSQYLLVADYDGAHVHVFRVLSHSGTPVKVAGDSVLWIGDASKQKLYHVGRDDPDSLAQEVFVDFGAGNVVDAFAVSL